MGLRAWGGLTVQALHLFGCQRLTLRPAVEQATMRREMIEPEAGVVDSESTGICSGKVPVQSIMGHPRPATPSTAGDLHLLNLTVYPTERDSWSRLRLLAWLLYCRLASAPWVQWLSGKSVRLVIGRSQVRFLAGSLWIFLSLSKAYIRVVFFIYLL